jgi:uncharacterized delta-60 repeat protein
MQRTRIATLHHGLARTPALLALAMALTPTFMYAQTPGSAFDTTFGTGGRVTINFGAAAIAVQADGRLVAAGAANVNGSLDFSLARYESNGALDTSFGPDGRVTTDFGSPWERANAVVIQADGKIVVAGGSVVGWFNDFALARYNTDGTLDTTFGNGGKVLTDFGVSADAYSVVVQPDGKIVAAGGANIDGGYNFELVRYNTDGTLDASFGTGGKVTTEFGLAAQGFSYATAFSLTLQTDGKLVAAGQAYNGTGFDAALARYESNGALDASFGTEGKVITDLGGRNDWTSSVAVLPDGRIVAAGQADVARGSGFALARYDSNGTLDTSFGTNGTVTTDFFLLEQGFSVAQSSAMTVLPDQRIVVVGRAYTNGGFHGALARYNVDGSLDASFGTGGKVSTNFGADYEAVRSVVAQPDGKIVTAEGGALARYH